MRQDRKVGQEKEKKRGPREEAEREVRKRDRKRGQEKKQQVRSENSYSTEKGAKKRCR